MPSIICTRKDRLSSYTHVTPVVSRRKNRGLESAHVTTPGAVMGDRVMAYSLRSSHTRPGEWGGFLSFLGGISYQIRILLYRDVSCMYPACIL